MEKCSSQWDLPRPLTKEDDDDSGPIIVDVAASSMQYIIEPFSGSGKRVRYAFLDCTLALDSAERLFLRKNKIFRLPRAFTQLVKGSFPGRNIIYCSKEKGPRTALNQCLCALGCYSFLVFISNMHY